MEEGHQRERKGTMRVQEDKDYVWLREGSIFFAFIYKYLLSTYYVPGTVLGLYQGRHRRGGI